LSGRERQVAWRDRIKQVAGLLKRAAHRLTYWNRRVISVAAYAVITIVSYHFAFLLRFEFDWSAFDPALIYATLPLLLGIRIACAFAFNISAGRWRFVGTRDVVRLVAGISAGTLIFWGLNRGLHLLEPIPRSIFAIEWVLTIYLTAALWIAYRVGFEQLRHYRSGVNGSAKRVLVVGAGEAGNMLVREMARFPTGYRPLGFVDDDPAKWGMRVQGVKVLGPTDRIGEFARAHAVDEVAIATPGAPPERLRRIVGGCEALGLKFKVLPGIAEVMAGDVSVHQLRDVRIEDLLGRDPIQLELPELAEDLRGRSVLITGAAGSIGSELARQVGLHEPETLVLLDQAETQLFYLELELRRKYPHLRLVPVVADVGDPAGLEHVFETYQPERVFHAAAYKHVPMMETNVRGAVMNNVLGTWRVADAAGRYGVDRCVLVSTDKAVRPTSVMGATKRLAELLVMELQENYPGTRYTAVRFGNVLGSNGSVIPVFQEQIRAQLPLTVTHPEASRYFMTIPEAVQLILKASVLREVRGRIAMLEMGEPVRILDLARNLLRLSGAHRLNGHAIVYTGLRPGEKLHEELIAPDEYTIPTSIPKVRLIGGPSHPPLLVLPLLPDIERRVREGAGGALYDMLCTLFPTLAGEALPTITLDAYAPTGAYRNGANGGNGDHAPDVRPAHLADVVSGVAVPPRVR
jgi:FlaA1/EpsC-like NDP-sugar epimerase